MEYIYVEVSRHAYCSNAGIAMLSRAIEPGNHRYRSSRESGFTMVELMIVVGLVGLASILAMPNFLDMVRRYQLKEATLEIADTLTMARMAAMNRNKTVTVSLAASGGIVHVSVAEASSGTLVIPDTTTMSQVNQVAGGPVSFNSLGMRTTGSTGGQQVALSTVNNHTYSVLITASGKVIPCFKASCP